MIGQPRFSREFICITFDHGGLVDYEEVAVERTFFVFAESPVLGLISRSR